MAVSREFLGFITEQLAPLGSIMTRRMFSGAGVYIDATIVALIFEDELYFKVDDSTRPAFAAEGCGPFTYDTRDGQRVVNGYWRAPERLFDDPDALHEFARAALAVSRRAAAKKRPTKSKARC